MKLTHENIRRIKCAIALMTLIILPVLFYKLLYTEHARLSFSCTANYNLIQPDLMINSDIYLIVDEEKHASFDINGTLKNKENTYRISRKYTFNYQLIDKKTLKLSNISLSKRGSDNASDSRLEYLIFNYDVQSEKLISLTKMMNSYVVSNIYSPLFICTSNS